VGRPGDEPQQRSGPDPRDAGGNALGGAAVPEVFHKERGLSLRPPLAWELELMEGCLRAVPEFMARRKQGDSAKEEIIVPVASGELRLVLSWVVDVT
jgi:hypothetical protein